MKEITYFQVFQVQLGFDLGHAEAHGWRRIVEVELMIPGTKRNCELPSSSMADEAYVFINRCSRMFSKSSFE